MTVRQKVPKSDFQSEFSISRIIQNFQIFFFFQIKDNSLEAHFLLNSCILGPTIFEIPQPKCSSFVQCTISM
jgi:hypothetical protein